MSKLKFAIFDLDNTLLLDEGVVASEAVTVLQFLKARGFELYIASYNRNARLNIGASNTLKVEWFDDIWGCKCKGWRKHDMINMIIQNRVCSMTNGDVPPPEKTVLYFDDTLKNVLDVDSYVNDVVSVLVDSKTGVKMSDIPKL